MCFGHTLTRRHAYEEYWTLYEAPARRRAWELNPHRSTAADGGGPLGHPKGVTRGPCLVAVAGRGAIGAKHSRAGPVTRGPWAEQSADRRGAVHTLPGHTVIRGRASL